MNVMNTVSLQKSYRIEHFLLHITLHKAIISANSTARTTLSDVFVGL